MSLSVDPNTNHFTTSGYGYDANGNVTSLPQSQGNLSLGYDVENRVQMGSGVWMFDMENQPLTGPGGMPVWDLNGRRLRHETISYGFTGGNYQYAQPGYTITDRNIYFGGRLIQSNSRTVLVDRTGSVRANEAGETFEYFPYGEELNLTSQDREKFATYTRSSANGLDYAVNRWYDSVHGHFITPDPAYDSAVISDPSSMNRYAYASGDPVNFNDPTGLEPCGDLLGFGSGQTLGQLIEGNSLAALLARVIWAESSRDAFGSSYLSQKEAIGWSVLDRYDILHGVYTLTTVGKQPLNPASLGFVPSNIARNATYSDVIGYGGFASVVGGGNPSLDSAFQNDLNRILSGDVLNTSKGYGPLVGLQDPTTGGYNPVNEECYNVAESYVAGNLAASRSLSNPLETRGVVTSFNTTGASAGPYLQNLGTLGSTTFFGFTGSTSRPSVRRSGTSGLIGRPVSGAGGVVRVP